MNRLRLSQLARALVDAGQDVAARGADPEVTGLTADSRRVTPGDLFVAAPGSRVDGAAYVDQALARGALGVVSQVPLDLPDSVGHLLVPDVAAAKPVLADTWFRHPSGRLTVIGITGTNGKTTTATMLRSMLTMDGRDTGLIGTLGAWIGEQHEPLANTTPDAIELQRLLARMVDANLSTVVMEVSSHALALGRVGGVDVDVAVFTNLSQDHLDFHGDMDAYASAKARLFEKLMPDGVAVINADDPAGPAMVERCLGKVLTYGLDQPADLSAEVRRLDTGGTAFHLVDAEGGRRAPVDLALLGRHNVANALAAAGAARALGLPTHAVVTGLAALRSVPGRLEAIDCGQEFDLLVDYAHTPDALRQVLALLRPLTRGRLRVVFGCGGDRDRHKRPLMGRAVAEAADALYVTSDNPRGEDPDAILDQILEGVPDADGARVGRWVDRRQAIAAACADAGPGDVVLVAGKGHETTQTIAGQVLPFDDRAVAREVLWTL